MHTYIIFATHLEIDQNIEISCPFFSVVAMLRRNGMEVTAKSISATQIKFVSFLFGSFVSFVIVFWFAEGSERLYATTVHSIDWLERHTMNETRVQKEHVQIKTKSITNWPENSKCYFEHIQRIFRMHEFFFVLSLLFFFLLIRRLHLTNYRLRLNKLDKMNNKFWIVNGKKQNKTKRTTTRTRKRRYKNKIVRCNWMSWMRI